MIITPIACTTIDWENFVTKSQMYIGRSPTRALDSNNLPAGPLDSFASALDEFVLKGTNPKQSTSEFTLNHISISFLCLFETYLYHEILEQIHRNIHIVRCQDLTSSRHAICIMTGSLKDWKESIINCYSSPEFSIEVWQILHKLGFERFFKEYKINSLNRIQKR